MRDNTPIIKPPALLTDDGGNHAPRRGRLAPVSGDGDDNVPAHQTGGNAHGLRPPAPPSPVESLADKYERRRREMIRHQYPILPLAFRKENLLDLADPVELCDATDQILLSQACREAITAAARLEQAWRTNCRGREDDVQVYPADPLVEELTRERNRSAEFLYDLRRRHAKLRQVEAVTRRTQAAAQRLGEAADSPPTPDAVHDGKGAQRVQNNTARHGVRKGSARRARPRGRRTDQSGIRRRTSAATVPTARPRHRKGPAAVA